MKTLHKWLTIIIGLQVLAWLVSGLVISLLDPGEVSGRVTADPSPAKAEALPQGPLLEPADLPGFVLDGALDIRLSVEDGLPVYRVRKPGGQVRVNALDGSVILTGKDDALRRARRDYTGSGEVLYVERGVAPDMETRDHRGDYWKVGFSDEAQTTIYVSVTGGDILERRNQAWRIRDFFWMLHIMDYEDRQDFNHFLVVFAALAAAWLGLTGFVLLFGSFNRHDFFFLNVFHKRNSAVVTLLDPALGHERRVRLRKGANLFVSLATHGVNLPSTCGGGGECGRCRVQIDSPADPETHAAEQRLLSERLRAQGFRLACQQRVQGDITLRVRTGTLTPKDS